MKIRTSEKDLWEKLEDIESELPFDRISNDILEGNMLFRKVSELETIVTDKRMDTLYRRLRIDANMAKKIENIRGFYSAAVSFLEAKYCLESIINGVSFRNNWINRTYGLAVNEGMLSGINKESRILIIGSGPLPESAFAYVEKFGSRVSCVDHSTLAVSLSSLLIRKMGLEEHIDVVLGEGTGFDCSGYSHIMVTSLAVPKRKIIANISRSSDNYTTIIYRDAGGIKEIIHEAIDRKLIEPYRIVGIASTRNTILYSLILKRKGIIEDKEVGEAI